MTFYRDSSGFSEAPVKPGTKPSANLGSPASISLVDPSSEEDLASPSEDDNSVLPAKRKRQPKGKEKPSTPSPKTIAFYDGVLKLVLSHARLRIALKELMNGYYPASLDADDWTVDAFCDSVDYYEVRFNKEIDSKLHLHSVYFGLWAIASHGSYNPCILFIFNP